MKTSGETPIGFLGGFPDGIRFEINEVILGGISRQTTAETHRCIPD